MLRRLESGYDNFYGNFCHSSQHELDEIERRVKFKESTISDLKYELSLLKEDRIRIYKHHINYTITDICIIGLAQKWISALSTNKMNGEKLDKRKHYEERDMFNFLSDWLNKKLNHQVNITTIYEYNFGEGWDIIFEFEDKKYSIYIPITRNIKHSSVEQYGAKYCFSIHLSAYSSESCSEVIGMTYNEDELKNIFQNYLDKCKQ